MNIVGERVILRAIEVSDTEFLLNLINDAKIEHFVGGYSFPVSGKQQEEWVKSLKCDHHTLRCVIEDKESKDTRIGTGILSNIDYRSGNAEIHIKLCENFRGKGYGVDNIKSLVKYAFKELRIHCIYCYILEYNLASQRTFEKAEFVKETIIRERIFKHGEYHNLLSYSIINELI